MKRLLIALALLLVPALAQAQCNGNFSANRYCGTGASSGAPGQQSFTNIFNNLPLTNGNIYVGNASNIATAVAPTGTGDCTFTFTNLGVFGYTCLKTNGVPFVASATTDTTNATNISTGTLNSARLPSPFTNGTASGNTSQFATVLAGTKTANHIATWDASGNIQDGGGSAGTVTTTGSPAANQTAVFSGATSITGIAAGNYGQALLSRGSGSTPAYQSGPWTLLNTLTASSSATLSDVVSFSASYNDYEIVFTNLVAATASVTPEFQVHSGGAFQNTNYIATATFLGSQGAQTTFIPFSYSANVPSGGIGISGRLIILGANSSVAGKWWFGQFIYAVSGTAATPNTVSGTWTGSSAAIDGFQFLFSSGNITSGTIKVYGRL